MRSQPARSLCIVAVIFAALAGACQSPPPTTPMADDAAAAGGRDTRPLAYVNSEPIRRDALLDPLIEAAGGEVLAELVLDRLIDQQLDERSQTLTEDELAAERERLLTALAPDDEDEAARVLRELRQQRGLGETRFQSFLRRNAGLRKLVADEVEVTDAAVRDAFNRRYGERYRARLIVVDSFEQAARLREQAIERQASFSDLAAEHSTDISADRGGLLSPINPADSSYPQVLRDALVRLDEQVNERGEQGGAPVSEVLAIEGQFALVKLEEKIGPEDVEFADVKDELAREVRARLEQRRMQQRARRMLSDANIVILDGALSDRWQRQREVLLNP